MTLDEDVAQQLTERMRERNASFKQTLNEVLRLGLRREPTEVSFDGPTFSATIRPGLDLDKALALAAAMEDDEIVRKVELGK